MTSPHQLSDQRGPGHSDPALDALRADLESQLAAESEVSLQTAEEFVRRAALQGTVHDTALAHVLQTRALMLSMEYKRAWECIAVAIELFGQAQDPVHQARSEALAGKICFALGEGVEAERLLRIALGRVSPSSDPQQRDVQGFARNVLGSVLFSTGRVKDALMCFEQALDDWRALDDLTGQVKTLTNIANIQSSIGNAAAAIHTLNEAYTTNHASGRDIKLDSFILIGLARAHWLNNDQELAVTVGRSALESARATRDGVLEATALLNLGSAYLGIDTELASAYLGQGIGLSRAIGFKSGEMSGLDSLGKLNGDLGHHGPARDALESALQIALELGETQGELESRLHLADVELSLGHLEQVEGHVRRGLTLAQESESPKEEAEAHRILSALGARQGDYRRAFEHAQEHVRIKDELFNTERDRQTRNLSIQFEVDRARHDANMYRIRTEVEQEARLAAEQRVKERTAELARAHQEIVTRLAMAAEYRDDTTGEHTRRVGRAAARIARGLGWPEERARILGVAARLHDVGKIGIPDSILLKAGKLTVDEYEQMKSHTLIGSRILSGGRSDLLRMAEEIALSHHERWDGRGYPFGLSGEAVPLTGRIVALADVFDALTQDRPYKQAWTSQEALAEIKGLAGTHFDPALVDLALEVLAPGGDALVDDGALDEEDASHLLNVFEQLQVERLRDVEEARLAAERSARELERMARTDVLTSLLNRRAFETDLEAAVRAPVALWVVSCDLDGLKATNDALGYGQGDGLLQRFAGALERVFAGVGRAYRMGGDEFAVIGSGAQDDASLRALMDAVLREAGGEGLPHVSASVGVARTPDDAQTPGDLLRESDRRMYADKLRRRAGA